MTERGIWTQVSREKKETRRTLKEKKLNSNNSYVIVASLDKLERKNWFTYLIRSAFSSLFFSSSEAPLWLSGSLSYKFFVLGHGWANPTTILCGLGPQDPLVLTILLNFKRLLVYHDIFYKLMRTLKNIFIFNQTMLVSSIYLWRQGPKFVYWALDPIWWCGYVRGEVNDRRGPMMEDHVKKKWRDKVRGGYPSRIGRISIKQVPGKLRWPSRNFQR